MYTHCDTLQFNRRNHHLVNEHTLSLMPGIGADGIACGNHLVSCARGGIVNEDDAFKALEDGTISSCALDVFENEPGTTHPILNHPNFRMVHHILVPQLMKQSKNWI